MVRRLMFACMVLVVLVYCTPVLAGETVVLTNGEWPPYHSEWLAGDGVASVLYREAFALVGVEVRYVFLPWKRAYEEARHGSAHGSVSWLKRVERQKHFWFSEPVMEANMVFFHAMGNGFDWRQLDDLKDLRIAVALADPQVPALQEVVRSGTGRLDVVRSYALGMKLLIAGRVDVFYCDREVGNYLLGASCLDASGVSWHPRQYGSGKLHLIVSRKNPKGRRLVERFNKGLAALKACGRYEEVFRTYFASDVDADGDADGDGRRF